MIVLFMGKVFIPIYEWFLSWNQMILAIVSVGLMITMVIDYAYSTFYMYKNKRMQRRWRWDIPNNWFYRHLVKGKEGDSTI